MTKDDSNNSHTNPKQNKLNSEDPSYYDVSFDFPVDSDDESHSDSLSPEHESSAKDSTNQQHSKWNNFHVDFHEKQRQQFMDLKNEEQAPFIDPAKDADRKKRAASLEDQIKTEAQEEEAVKASLMLDRSIRRVRSLFSDFEAYSPPTSNPYKTDVHAALKQRQSDPLIPKQPEQETMDGNNSHSSWRSRFSKSNSSDSADVKENIGNSPNDQQSLHNVSEENVKDDVNVQFSVKDTNTEQVVLPEGSSTSSKLESDKEAQSSTSSFGPSYAAASNRRFSSDIPSPEEIAKERERRRRLRIEQLEAMSSEEEIEQSYQGGYGNYYKPEKATHSKEKETLPQTAKPIFTFSKEVDHQSIINKTSETIQPSSIDDALEDSEKNVTLDNNWGIQPETSEKVEDDIQSKEDVTNLHENPAEESVITETNEYPTQTDDIIDESTSSDDEEVKLDQDQLHLSDKTTEKDKEKAKEDKIDHQDLPLSKSDSLDNDSSESHIIDLDTKTIAAAAVATALSAIPGADNDATAFSPSSGTPVSQSVDGSVNLEDHALAVSHRDDVSVTVIHDPVENDPEVEAYDKAMSEQPVVVSRLKKKDKPIYSLANYSLKEKILFGFNVAFNVFKRLFFYILLIGILLGAMAGGAGAGYFANLVSKTPPPSREEMAAQVNRLEQQSTLYYASGEPIANIRADIVRSVASIDNISPYIIDGLIATEDEEFYEHPGVMPRAILRATLETLLTGGGTGGSTLTQQLVKQQMLSHDVTFFRKANEILLALRLENYLSKDEILTAYLNVSPFGRNNNGDNVAGILKASEGIFGLKPDEVNLAQAAFLVGLPQDPYAYTPYNQYGELTGDYQAGIDRMHEVLFRMYREQKITKAEYDEALTYDITQDFLPQEPREEQRQSYLYQAMMDGAIEQIMLLNIEEDGLNWKQVYEDFEWYNEYYFNAEEQLRTGGYKVYTTIDRQIYDQLQESAQAYDDELGVTYDGVYVDPETGEEIYYLESVQTGIVVIDNRSGKVLGFVAGTDFENNQIDHAFNMRRSPGSTIKPLAVYGPAVEENIITPATIIPDTEYVQEYADGSVWRPTNYGNVVSGTYFSARTALLRSDNIPAVRIYEELLNRGVPIIDYLEKMGFNTVDSYTESDTQNLAFALGGVTTGPTVFEETRAFSTFANNGQYVDSYYIERIEDAFGNVVFQQDTAPVQVFSEDTNYILVDMLRDTNTEGSGRTAGEALAFGGDWIAKSGISENSKDVWYIASTPAVTIGSWIGYDSQYADFTIDVNDGFDREAVRSQTYWARVVNDLYALRPEIFGVDQTFAQPDSVRTQTILTNTGTLPGNLNLNNRQYNITSPTSEDVFKVSHPAPALTYNFMFNATDDDHQRFWAQFQQAADELRQQQQQQPPAPESSSSSSSSQESTDETSSEPDETPADESTPPAEPPAG